MALRHAEAGSSVEEICRKLGISGPTFHLWKREFAGTGVPEARRLKQLVADLPRTDPDPVRIPAHDTLLPAGTSAGPGSIFL